MLSGILGRECLGKPTHLPEFVSSEVPVGHSGFLVQAFPLEDTVYPAGQEALRFFLHFLAEGS